jgi:hypothetical protein
MEKVEHAARITFVARVLGGEKKLTAEELAKLRAVSVQSYGEDFSTKIACAVGDGEGEMNDDEVRRYVEQKLISLGIIS